MSLWGRVVENSQYAWAYLWSGRTFAIALGILFAVIAIALLIATQTRWGKAKPLTKCVVLSVLAHVWLLVYACSSRVVLPQGDPNGARDSSAVSLDATLLEAVGPLPSSDSAMAEDPATVQVSDDPAFNRSMDQDVFAIAPMPDVGLMAPELLSEYEPTPLPDLPEDTVPSERVEPSLTEPLDNRMESIPPKNSLSPPRSLGELASMPRANPSSDRQSDRPSNSRPSDSLASSKPEQTSEYQLRQSADRLQLARPFGADQDTEAAVETALIWLARAQSPEGAWNAKQFGAGTETYALGVNRNGTGDRADTGVTGLALLAFLSGGHTHLQGKYQVTVRTALEYLLRSQMSQGDLTGLKQVGSDMSVTNARMYCHGIATLALAEAYAMTHDEWLRGPLIKAVTYTLKAQDPQGGGWRYQPQSPGDLSQFGWQAMALRSTERSGMVLEPIVKQRMKYFVDSCSTGKYGGLARYRPGEGAPSPTMTAEALACRLLLNHSTNSSAAMEARDNLIQNLPGTGEDNVYYWYYATLALFQLQDQSWQRWNQALKTRLLSTQRPAYDSDAGSWDPDRVWGGYGGRVYSTAMSCLCLEVYYRYLPLYGPRRSE